MKWNLRSNDYKRRHSSCFESLTSARPNFWFQGEVILSTISINFTWIHRWTICGCSPWKIKHIPWLARVAFTSRERLWRTVFWKVSLRYLQQNIQIASNISRPVSTALFYNSSRRLSAQNWESRYVWGENPSRACSSWSMPTIQQQSRVKDLLSSSLLSAQFSPDKIGGGKWIRGSLNALRINLFLETRTGCAGEFSHFS